MMHLIDEGYFSRVDKNFDQAWVGESRTNSNSEMVVE